MSMTKKLITDKQLAERGEKYLSFAYFPGDTQTAEIKQILLEQEPATIARLKEAERLLELAYKPIFMDHDGELAQSIERHFNKVRKTS